MKKILIVFLLNLSVAAFAGESLFGISNKSLGLLNNTNSAPGMARSYEIASMDTTQINYQNYALWTNQTITSYSAKISYRAAFGEDGQTKNYFNDVANFGGGYLTVPLLKRRLAFGLGLTPFTNMEQRYRLDYDDGQSKEVLVKGGLSKAHLNLSYKIMEKAGIGLGYEYIFGKITKNFRQEDSNVAFDPIKLYYEYRFNGQGLVASAFYHPYSSIQFGLFFRPQTTVDLKIQANTISDNVNLDEIHTLTIPAQFGGGVEYSLNPRWNMGMDLEYQNWRDEYTVDKISAGNDFAQHLKIGIGFEKKQSPKLFTNILEQIDYRFGGFYRTLSTLSSGNEINEYGLSLGFSFPLQRFRSKIDFAGIVGKRGNLDKNRYQETFFKFGLSISAMERWFVAAED